VDRLVNAELHQCIHAARDIPIPNQSCDFEIELQFLRSRLIILIIR
jgi:hypothetical protein